MTTDNDFAKQLEELVRMDDERVGLQTTGPIPGAGIPDPNDLKVAWVVARAPFLGGEYYRGTRPAMLTSREFDWHTAVCDRMATNETDKSDRRLSFMTPGPKPHVITPDVIILRGIREWTIDWTLRAKSAGQVVLCDLDDDVWAHEDWTPDSRPDDDHFEEWCWSVDAWLVSTPVMADRIRERMESRANRKIVPVIVAPNCYDPIGIGRESHPVPGNRIGTRMWLSGRMSGDLELYRDLFVPWIEPLDLAWVHIGREEMSGGPGEGTHGIRSFTDLGVPVDRLIELPSMTLLDMGRTLGSTLSIGAIAMADHPFNRAKTETHAVELASAGLPLVAATDLSIYDNVPGVVEPNREAVGLRIQQLVSDRACWVTESLRARQWAQATAIMAEADYLAAVHDVVEELIHAKS